MSRSSSATFLADIRTLAVAPAVLSGYVQYQNSECVNGAVLRVEDGHRFVEDLPSHHGILATGDLLRRVELMASVMRLEVQRLEHQPTMPQTRTRCCTSTTTARWYERQEQRPVVGQR
jgi:hypothetical protein